MMLVKADCQARGATIAVLTLLNFGRIPLHYIHTLEDRDFFYKKLISHVDLQRLSVLVALSRPNSFDFTCV